MKCQFLVTVDCEDETRSSDSLMAEINTLLKPKMDVEVRAYEDVNRYEYRFPPKAKASVELYSRPVNYPNHFSSQHDELLASFAYRVYDHLEKKWIINKLGSNTDEYDVSPYPIKD